jgi:hypothetical protein
MTRPLWDDDGGSTLVTSEIVFLFAILVLGLITGLVALRQSVISELVETAQALMALNQSFSFSGDSNCESATPPDGSSASDTTNTIGEGSVSARTAAIAFTPCD